MDDVSGMYKSKIGTEREYFDNQSAMFSNADKSMHSPMTSARNANTMRKGGKRELEGADIIHEHNRSADFGSISSPYPKYNASDNKSFKMPTPPKRQPSQLVDQEGHSDESSEGIVANHDPFNGIQDAIDKQDEMRKSAKLPTESSSEEEKQIIQDVKPQELPKQNQPSQHQTSQKQTSQLNSNRQSDIHKSQNISQEQIIQQQDSQVLHDQDQ